MSFVIEPVEPRVLFSASPTALLRTKIAVAHPLPSIITPKTTKTHAPAPFTPFSPKSYLAGQWSATRTFRETRDQFDDVIQFSQTGKFISGAISASPNSNTTFTSSDYASPEAFFGTISKSGTIKASGGFGGVNSHGPFHVLITITGHVNANDNSFDVVEKQTALYAETGKIVSSTADIIAFRASE